MSKDNPLPLLQIPSIPGSSASSFVNESFQPSGDEESVHLQSPPKGNSKTRKDRVQKKRLTRGGTCTNAHPSATTSTATFNQPSESVIINIEPPIPAVSSEDYKSGHQSTLQLPSTSGSSFANEAFEPPGDEEFVHPQAHPQGKSTIKPRKDQVHKKGPKVLRKEKYIISRSTASTAPSNKSRGSATVDIEPPNASVSSEMNEEADHEEEEGDSAYSFVNEAFDLSGDGGSVHHQDQPQNKSGIKPRNDEFHKKSPKVRRSAGLVKACSLAATSEDSSDKSSGSVTLNIEPPIATVFEEVDKCAGQPHPHLAPTPGSSTATSPKISYGSLGMGD